MIMRIWRGTTRPEDAERYARYVYETGFGEYLETPRNLGAHLVQRELGDRVETVTVTFWDSWEAIKAFAGDDPSLAHYYPEDDAFLLDRPKFVEHYDVVESTLKSAGTSPA